jgi:Periplasmic copper-binding protein (NosD)
MTAKSAKPGTAALVATVLACVALLVGGCHPGPAPGASVLMPERAAAAAGLGAGPAAAGPLEALDPKSAPYNARGDGVTDDTDALQAWLTAGGVRLADGTFRIVRGLTLAGNDRQLYTDNAKILADRRNITALTATGNNANIRVHIDGNNKAAYGLKVTGAGAVVENGRYENLRSTRSARGIDATTTGGITVRNNVVRNVVSVGDGIRGNGPGLSRAIGLNARAAAAAGSIIAGNSIENILGEEGDAIHVLFSDRASNPFNSGKTTISDNEIRNVSRRFIKVQASDVAVERNKLHFDLTTPPAHPGSAIAVIRSEFVTVTGNEINPNLIGGGISVTGSAQAPLRGIDIQNNVVRQKDSKDSVSIYLEWTTSPTVRNNVVYGGGPAVAIGSSTNAREEGNVHHRGVR